jgi:hypothetical protein
VHSLAAGRRLEDDEVADVGFPGNGQEYRVCGKRRLHRVRRHDADRDQVEGG